MKRIFALILALVLIFTSCSPKPTKDTENSIVSSDDSQNISNKQQEEINKDWIYDLPRMDGSTSTIPLEAGIRSALFGISLEEAELQVNHSSKDEPKRRPHHELHSLCQH